MKKEELDKDLKFTEKYNWWTPDEKKAWISTITKLEYVMLRGTADEVLFVWKNFDKKSLIFFIFIIYIRIYKFINTIKSYFLQKSNKIRLLFQKK